MGIKGETGALNCQSTHIYYCKPQVSKELLLFSGKFILESFSDFYEALSVKQIGSEAVCQ